MDVEIPHLAHRAAYWRLFPETKAKATESFEAAVQINLAHITARIAFEGPIEGYAGTESRY